MPRKRRTLDDAMALAQSRGGALLSKRFVTVKTHYRWLCEKNHSWKATFESVQRGTWCPRCAAKVVNHRDRMATLRKAARNRGGIVLSKHCPRVDAKVEFECKKGHRFFSDYEHVVGQLTWCPHCRVFVGEEVTRGIFELLTGQSFTRCNPSWLVTKQGRRMQLDGYCDSLRLAFEYQGIQHAKEMPKFFHRDSSFRRQQERDKRKLSLCGAQGITLLQVVAPRRLRDLPRNIAALLKDAGIVMQLSPDRVDLLSLGLDPDSSASARFHQAVEAKSGKVLARRWHGVNEQTLIRCRHGHVFAQTPKRIHQGRWCPDCATSELRLGMEAVRALAESLNATCVSRTYSNVDTAMTFRCKACRRRWVATTASLQRGTGCPFCAGPANGGRTRRTIADINKVAAKRGGKCLSAAYVSAHGTLLWECCEGHTWSASANNVSRGTWCPVCSLADRSRAVRDAHARRGRRRLGRP